MCRVPRCAVGRDTKGSEFRRSTVARSALLSLSTDSSLSLRPRCITHPVSFPTPTQPADSVAELGIRLPMLVNAAEQVFKNHPGAVRHRLVREDVRTHG